MVMCVEDFVSSSGAGAAGDVPQSLCCDSGTWKSRYDCERIRAEAAEARVAAAASSAALLAMAAHRGRRLRRWRSGWRWRRTHPSARAAARPALPTVRIRIIEIKEHKRRIVRLRWRRLFPGTAFGCGRMCCMRPLRRGLADQGLAVLPGTLAGCMSRIFQRDVLNSGFMSIHVSWQGFCGCPR